MKKKPYRKLKNFFFQTVVDDLMDVSIFNRIMEVDISTKILPWKKSRFIRSNVIFITYLKFTPDVKINNYFQEIKFERSSDEFGKI